MLVGVQLSVPGSYLPPVLRVLYGVLYPPHTIISLLVQTAVCQTRTSGALVILVEVHVSVFGLYLPPLLRIVMLFTPPQTIISLPVHTAV